MPLQNFNIRTESVLIILNISQNVIPWFHWWNISWNSVLDMTVSAAPSLFPAKNKHFKSIPQNVSMILSHLSLYNKFPIKITNFLSRQWIFLQRLTSLVAREKRSILIYIKINFKEVQNVDFWQDLAGFYLLWKGKEWDLPMKMMKLSIHLPNALCILLYCIINLEHNMFSEMKEIPLRLPILILVT